MDRRSQMLLKHSTSYPRAIGFVKHVYVTLPGSLLLFLVMVGGPAGLGYYYYQADAVKFELSLDAFQAPNHVVSREWA